MQFPKQDISEGIYDVFTICNIVLISFLMNLTWFCLTNIGNFNKYLKTVTRDLTTHCNSQKYGKNCLDIKYLKSK